MMDLINLEQGSLVFYNNKQYKIFRAVDFHTIALEDLETSEIIKVSLNELSSQKVAIKENNYLDNYSEKEWEIAKKRYEIIKELIFTERTKASVIETAKKYGYHYTMLYKWINLYEHTSQISSLVPKNSQKGTKGSKLNQKVESIIQDILEELYLHKQRYNFRRIYNRIYNECKKISLDVPHENTVRNRIAKMDPKESIKKRYGPKASKEQFDNFEGEFPEGKYPLEFIQIDHTPLDIIVVDKTHRKPLGRPYLTLAIDVYSRMIAGIHISLQAPSYYSVGQCLYNIFSQKEKFLFENGIKGEWNIFGIPRIIGVDNGADLVSSDMQRVCDEFGITLMKRPVARPQFGAHVERVLGTINREVHNLSGTTFSNITEKATYNSQKEASYTIEELTQWILYYIVNIYHKKYHSGILMTPEQKYYQGIFGDGENAGTGILPSIIDNDEYIKITLLPTEFRTIQNNGITLDGITYYSDVLRHWIGKLDAKKNKMKHKIKRDPLNIQKIYFYDPEIKEYFEVPYRKISAPIMTLWDLYAVKKYLKEQKIADYNEDDIFKAYEKLESLEKEIKDKHQKHKRQAFTQLPKKSHEIKTKEIQKDSKQNNNYNHLFDNVQLFDVKGVKNED